MVTLMSKNNDSYHKYENYNEIYDILKNNVESNKELEDLVNTKLVNLKNFIIEQAKLGRTKYICFIDFSENYDKLSDIEKKYIEDQIKYFSSCNVLNYTIFWDSDNRLSVFFGVIESALQINAIKIPKLNKDEPSHNYVYYVILTVISLVVLFSILIKL